MHGSEVAIRRATSDDAGAIAGIHVRGWRATYRGRMPDAVLDGLSVQRRATVWAAAVTERSDGHAVWVAERSGSPVGFVDIGAAPDADVPKGTGRVFTIYVDPDALRSGVGRALMSCATRELRAGGFVHAVLWVMSSNEEARRFYEALGWTVDGAVQTEDFGGASIEEVRYAVDLEAAGPVSAPQPAS
jgi:ribosomal protein S18 acetylase RimI-like enzyme